MKVLCSCGSATSSLFLICSRAIALDTSQYEQGYQGYDTSYDTKFHAGDLGGFFSYRPHTPRRFLFFYIRWDSGTTKKLRAAQRAWLAFRDAHLQKPIRQRTNKRSTAA